MNALSFLEKLSYPQALVLSLSEVMLMREETSDPVRRDELLSDENYIRAEFGQLSPGSQLLALAWVRGKFGPGYELDRRSN